jgi:enoyl-CoA hydratase/carnithine racemase
VYPRDELRAQALAMARRIAAASPSAVKAVTQTLRMQQDMYAQGLGKGLDWEAENQAQNYATGDVLEGVAAIKEKRAPNFGPAH